MIDKWLFFYIENPYKLIPGQIIGVINAKREQLDIKNK